jgi:hypothetical protein
MADFKDRAGRRADDVVLISVIEIMERRFIHRYVGKLITREDVDCLQSIRPVKIYDVVTDDVIRSASMHTVLVLDIVNDIIRNSAVVNSIHIKVDRGGGITRIAVPGHVVKQVVVNRDVSALRPSGSTVGVNPFSYMMHVVVFNYVILIIAAYKSHAAANRLGKEISVDRTLFDTPLYDYAILSGIEKTAVLDSYVPGITQTNQSSFNIRMQRKRRQDF